MDGNKYPILCLRIEKSAQHLIAVKRIENRKWDDDFFVTNTGERLLKTLYFVFIDTFKV